MPYPQIDRSRLRFRPLDERQSKTSIRDVAINPDAPFQPLEGDSAWAKETVDAVLEARRAGRPVVCSFGAHLIKNGLGTLLIKLMERGLVTCLTTNGAGAIHDWEFAFRGWSEEDVRRYIAEGHFGLWRETGRNLNAAIIAGAARSMGLGESIGQMILDNGVDVPTREEIRMRLEEVARGAAPDDNDSALVEALTAIERYGLPEGRLPIRHECVQYSVLAAARRLRVPVCVMPGIGYDIIHAHPLCGGGALGRAAMRDFLTFANVVSSLEKGVYFSIGSAIMSPMTFEKALSMARNLAGQANRSIENFLIVVNDIQPGEWDWNSGEPPKDHPAYYLRFCKSFSRMGVKTHYVREDNRAFLGVLTRRLLNVCPTTGFGH